LAGGDRDLMLAERRQRLKWLLRADPHHAAPSRLTCSESTVNVTICPDFTPDRISRSSARVEVAWPFTLRMMSGIP
jgi:hypothetical protein